MFENKLWEGIYYSRFIASYYDAGGVIHGHRKQFTDWLMQLLINGKHMPERIANEIYWFATDGKLELETNAAKYLESIK